MCKYTLFIGYQRRLLIILIIIDYSEYVFTVVLLTIY